MNHIIPDPHVPAQRHEGDLIVTTADLAPFETVYVLDLDVVVVDLAASQPAAVVLVAELICREAVAR